MVEIFITALDNVKRACYLSTIETGASRDIRGGDKTMANHPNRSKTSHSEYTVSYCQTRGGHCAQRAETTIRATDIVSAAQLFVARQAKKGRGFINTWIVGADGVKHQIEQAKSWADSARLLPPQK